MDEIIHTGGLRGEEDQFQRGKLKMQGSGGEVEYLSLYPATERRSEELGLH